MKEILELILSKIEESILSMRKQLNSQNARIQKLEEAPGPNIANEEKQGCSHLKNLKKLKKRIKRSEKQILGLKQQISKHHMSSYGIEHVNDELSE